MTATSSYAATDDAGYEQLIGRWSRRVARVLPFTGTAEGKLRSCVRAALRAALARAVKGGES